MKRTLVTFTIILVVLMTGCSAKKVNADSGNVKGTLKDYGITIDYEKENDNIFCEIYIDDIEDYYLSFMIGLYSDDNVIQAMLSRKFRNNEAFVYTYQRMGVDWNNRSMVIDAINNLIDMSEESFRNTNNIKNMLARIIYEQ